MSIKPEATPKQALLMCPDRGTRGILWQEPVLTPQEVRAQTQRERREKEKARQLDRRTKRQSKRSQAY